ncbi:lipase family protein [Pseudomonas fluorescens]|uniref:Fungal lipase-type domain-containing protein n=1 Tax=Pseudomonas fluorescens TaxID=294 RepID=A0A5E7PTA7_PSEFL|nr:lipase family protein [Pseudomonas fluorescens]VVP53136.1 hypothetical protein PS880_05485 [Pseudomonas fluorescens]
MSVRTLPESDYGSFDGRIVTCPLRDHSTSFQLVDEFGEGKPYAGLVYEITDYEDVVYTGTLDANGSGKVDTHYCGPVVLKLNQRYEGQDAPYVRLKERKAYPLPITELQVRAENTRFFNKTGARTHVNPAQAKADSYYQVEVRELVDHVAHLPPMVERRFPPNTHVFALFRQESTVRSPKPAGTGYRDGGKNTTATSSDDAMAELGFAPAPPKLRGIALLPNKHHVLEVRPLRALRPLISTSNDFCALNLYQLALMSTLSYSAFGQYPHFHPVETDSVSFPLQPSSGNWFGDALAKSDELWMVDADQTGGKAYYPLYEEVPYSRRLEIVPFDPELYPEVNSPGLGEHQENPANIHFFDDSVNTEGTDTQAYITHHDEMILIAVRGTAEEADGYRDADAEQVPFAQGDGKVHNGFYGAAKAVRGFITNYLDKFYSGQKLVITGHSLGGAVALILSEMLRRDEEFSPDILLYTYGSPRAGDESFVKGASALKHHRTVNHNDPVPSVPATWMNTVKPRHLVATVPVMALNAPVGMSLFIAGLVNFTGESYAHHGELHHFMQVDLDRKLKSAILWQPGCSIINDQGCARALKEIDGLPVPGAFLRQLVDNADHKMVVSYIPHCWATLLRWQESLQSKSSVVTDREFNWVSDAIISIKEQLRAFQRHNAGRPARQMESRTMAAESDRLMQEISDLEDSRLRLGTLLKETISDARVYGRFAEQPELLTESLVRWKDHPENTVREQLAMKPPALDDHDQFMAEITGRRVVGDPYTLDIDSIG